MSQSIVHNRWKTESDTVNRRVTSPEDVPDWLLGVVKKSKTIADNLRRLRPIPWGELGEIMALTPLGSEAGEFLSNLIPQPQIREYRGFSPYIDINGEPINGETLDDKSPLRIIVSTYDLGDRMKAWSRIERIHVSITHERYHIVDGFSALPTDMENDAQSEIDILLKELQVRFEFNLLHPDLSRHLPTYWISKYRVFFDKFERISLEGESAGDRYNNYDRNAANSKCLLAYRNAVNNVLSSLDIFGTRVQPEVLARLSSERSLGADSLLLRDESFKFIRYTKNWRS